MLIGIVGKPNCGKSTFFKASTLAEVEIANYPFATIKPNHGTGYIKVECPEKDFKTKCSPRLGFCIGGERFVPIELIDVAGLVPGAHEGKGMGNQFLDDLRQADVLIHVIDCAGTTNEKGEPAEPNSYDPAFDIRFLEKEMDMWYLRLIKKGWEKFSRGVNQEKSDLPKALAKQLSALNIDEKLCEKLLSVLDLPKGPIEWSEDHLKLFARELRKETKPMIIACNKTDIPGALNNFKRLEQEFPGYPMIPCSSETELALREAANKWLISYIPGENDFKILKPGSLNENQKKALDFMKSFLKERRTTGVQEVLDKSCYELLNCIAAFPVPNSSLKDSDGKTLPDCFLLKKGSTALDFAFKIHTDIGKKFIRAVDMKTKRTVGKDHVLQHRDVIEIVDDM